MKTNALALTAALLAAATLAPSAHGQGDPERPRPDAPAPPPGGGALLGALDANRDGKIDAAEIDMAVVNLRKLDRDGDGSIQGDELGAPPLRRPFAGRGDAPRPDGAGATDRPPRRLPALIDLDADGDGKISKEEAPERMRERFGQIDTDGDGFLDKAEQDELTRRLRDRFSRPGGDAAGGGRQREPQGSGETVRPRRPPAAE